MHKHMGHYPVKLCLCIFVHKIFILMIFYSDYYMYISANFWKTGIERSTFSVGMQ